MPVNPSPGLSFTVAAPSPAQAYRAVDALDGSGAGGDFGSVLGDALNTAIASGHAADSQAKAAIEGHANLTNVVTALSKAELALQTTSTIRDRMVAAYQDIMKMAI